MSLVSPAYHKAALRLQNFWISISGVPILICRPPSRIGNPAELVLVRVCGDLNKPPAERFAYGNCLNGLARIAKDEGVGRLFLGLGPNVARSVVMNIGQLGAVSIINENGHRAGMVPIKP